MLDETPVSDSTAIVSLHCMRMCEQELCDRMNGTLAVDSLFKHLCRLLFEFID